MWPFSRRIQNSRTGAQVAFCLAVLMSGTLLVPSLSFSSTPAVGVGDVTTAMWYETNVDTISAADSDDTDRIIGTPVTAITRRDDSSTTIAPAWPINFFGTKYEGLCITTNGTVSPVATPSSSCSNNYDRAIGVLASNAGAPLIAAFANDVDGTETIRPHLGVSISTARFAAAESGNRTLTVTTRTDHGLSSGTANVCVMFASPDINNGASSTLWRTDEFWRCGTAVNATSRDFEMTVPLTFNSGENMDITNLTTANISPVFSRIYMQNANPLNQTVDNSSFSVQRGYDGFGHVSSVYYGTATIRGQDAMVITWYRHAQNDDDNADVLFNTFQIVLVKKATENSASAGFDFDFEFNYGTIQDGDDGYSAASSTTSCRSMSSDCRTGVGVSDFKAGLPDVYELFPSTPSRDLVDWGGSSSLTANSLNATVGGVTTLGRYSFTFTGGQPRNFGTPVMDGSGQVVGGSSSGLKPVPPSATYTGPIVLSVVTPVISSLAGSTLVINGRRLDIVNDVFIGDSKVLITSRRPNELVVRTPGIRPGNYKIRVVSKNDEFVFDGITVSLRASASPSLSKTTSVTGFAPGSSTLTAAMRTQLRSLIAAAPESATVTCRGFTSGPASLPRDQILADRRSKVACNFISKLRPDLEVRELSGRTSDVASERFRMVRVRIIG